MVSKAIELSQTEPKGPLYISFPQDLMEKDIPDYVAKKLEEIEVAPKYSLPIPHEHSLDILAFEIKRAKHPLVIAGNLVIGEQAINEIKEVIEHYKTPIITGFAAKGIVP